MRKPEVSRFFVAWLLFNFILIAYIRRTDQDFSLKLLSAIWLSTLVVCGFVYEQMRMEQVNRTI